MHCICLLWNLLILLVETKLKLTEMICPFVRNGPCCSQTNTIKFTKPIEDLLNIRHRPNEQDKVYCQINHKINNVHKHTKSNQINDREINHTQIEPAFTYMNWHAAVPHCAHVYMSRVALWTIIYNAIGYINSSLRDSITMQYDPTSWQYVQ